MIGPNVVASYFNETHKKQQLVEIFAQYVPPELARSIGKEPGQLEMRTEARELTVMFCDVHRFTAISEQLDPQELAELLNTILSPLTRIIHRHKGTIDKYMGDAIMAFWGAPVHDAQHQANAVSAAFEMQEALANLRRRFRARGWPEIHMGIGINSGLMNVGNMGSEYRVAYTAIGDAVNLASRLQDLTRLYNARILVGENTRKGFPAPTYRELGLVQVKGKSSLARVFEPCNPSIDPESTIVATMNRHNEALQSYYARDWDRSNQLFLMLKSENPEDPLYDYYLARVAEYRRRAPLPDWKGEIRYTVS